ncbi:MAG: hypothetical protein M9939_02445 [Mesorhizobium sp.]|nr:hypothetical protein [Mesorhizobium sp.]MCO5159969.1 hypothetical protein [Mesorhizobium sp.]
MNERSSKGLHGYLAGIVDGVFTGWAFDGKDPKKRQTIRVAVDGVFTDTTVADQFREGLLKHGKGDGRHQFSYPVPNGIAPHRLTFHFADGRRIPTPDRRANRRAYVKRHPYVRGEPRVSYCFSAPEFTQKDIDIAGRLIAAYAVSLETSEFERQAYKGLWKKISDDYHAELRGLLKVGAPEPVARHLHRMHFTRSIYGIGQGNTERLMHNPVGQKNFSLEYWDVFVCLAEVLGCFSMEDPLKAGHWGENIYRPFEEVEKAISDYLGVDITPPDVTEGLLGLKSRGAPYYMRTLEAIYAGHRLRELGDRPICEIGAGLGWAGYYAVLMGAEDYTMVDLPIMNVLQGYCMLKSLPQNEVRLSGETHAAKITIGTPEALFARDPSHFGIFYNQDSFPEIGRYNMHQYLNYMRGSPQALLLSINQESEGRSGPDEKQLVVHREIAECGGFKRLSRHVHWLRAGYMEQVFRVT